MIKWLLYFQECKCTHDVFFDGYRLLVSFLLIELLLLAIVVVKVSVTLSDLGPGVSYVTCQQQQISWLYLPSESHEYHGIQGQGWKLFKTLYSWLDVAHNTNLMTSSYKQIEESKERDSSPVIFVHLYSISLSPKDKFLKLPSAQERTWFVGAHSWEFKRSFSKRALHLNMAHNILL